MRTIKFRVWDQDGNFFHNYQISNGFYGLYELLDKDYGRHNFIIQQFTGLKDKNGVEIYEGDILEMFDNLGKIVYLDAAFIFQTLDSSEYELNKNEVAALGKIIGNIFENIDLLNGKLDLK
jgi:hypothetical protein